jgi:uncharacterized protein (TIGR02266 family)
VQPIFDEPETASHRADTIPAAGEDRRRDARFLLSLAVTMKGDNNFYTGLSEDISDGGVFIATLHLLPVGTPVVLWFTVPTSDAPIALQGTVRWVRGPDAGAKAENIFASGRELADVMPGMGVQFQDVSDETRRAIRKFMLFRKPDFFE